MNKGDYLNKDETKLSEVSASYKREWAENRKGQLICTDSRIVFFNSSEITDINLGSADAIEYNLPTYNMSYLYMGGLFALFGLVILGIERAAQIGDTGILLGSTVFLTGIGITLWGIVDRKSTLAIHTPKKSFEFTSKEDKLVEIVRSARSV